jgi:plasmid stabilization system protein ParE
MRVVITEAAKVDLIAIGDYIAEHTPVRAATFIDELLDSCFRLADRPRACPLVPRYEHWGVRRRVHGSYLIFYRIREDLVEVVHVLHGARDYETLLFPGSEV